MLSDINEFRNLFTEVLGSKRALEIEDCLEPMEGVRSIIAAENDEDFHLAFVSLLTKFPDITPDLIEHLLKMRIDIDKEVKKAMLDMVRQTYEKEKKLTDEYNEAEAEKAETHDDEDGAHPPAKHQTKPSIFGKYGKYAPVATPQEKEGKEKGGLSYLKKIINTTKETAGAVLKSPALPSTPQNNNNNNSANPPKTPAAPKDDVDDVKVSSLADLLAGKSTN